MPETTEEGMHFDLLGPIQAYVDGTFKNVGHQELKDKIEASRGSYDDGHHDRPLILEDVYALEFPALLRVITEIQMGPLYAAKGKRVEYPTIREAAQFETMVESALAQIKEKHKDRVVNGEEFDLEKVFAEYRLNPEQRREKYDALFKTLVDNLPDNSEKRT